MKKTLSISLLLLSVALFAQEEVELSKNQLNANLIPLSLSYEGRIDDNKSFTFGGGLEFTGWVEDDNSGLSDAYFFVVPRFTTSFRNYYKRKNVKKDNLRNNSGNYFGLHASLQLAPLGSKGEGIEAIAYEETSNVYTIGPVWGIQRNYASGIHLGLSLGAGIMGGENIDIEPSFVGEFELGFVLFSKK